MTLIAFLIVIVFLVLVHEAGHFIVAKKSGIRVDEFGIGFPPRLFSIRKGETLYSINALPFGGFVKMYGEDGLEDGAKDPRAFTGVSRYKQAITLSAGVAFNFLCAWILISIGFMVGLPASPLSDSRVEGAVLTVTQVIPETPAVSAGFKTGDKIISIQTGDQKVSVETAEEASALIASSESEIHFSIRRGEEEKDIVVNPTQDPDTGKSFVGIGMDAIGTLKLPPHEALYVGGSSTLNMSALIVGGLFDLARDALFGKADLKNVTGPVGIAGLAGDAFRMGFAEFVSFTAIISIHLAILNLLPIPALDGGRLLFLGIEAIRKKALSQKTVAFVHTVSFLLLILLMIVVTYRDILRLF